MLHPAFRWPPPRRLKLHFKSLSVMKCQWRQICLPLWHIWHSTRIVQMLFRFKKGRTSLLRHTSAPLTFPCSTSGQRRALRSHTVNSHKVTFEIDSPRGGAHVHCSGFFFFPKVDFLLRQKVHALTPKQAGNVTCQSHRGKHLLLISPSRCTTELLSSLNVLYI